GERSERSGEELQTGEHSINAGDQGFGFKVRRDASGSSGGKKLDASVCIEVILDDHVQLRHRPLEPEGYSDCPGAGSQAEEDHIGAKSCGQLENFRIAVGRLANNINPWILGEQA